MGTEHGDESGRPGAELARLLRKWWEESARDGREKPTQQSLALRLGIDQTTLSRYLNPRHASTAPLRVVEALHARLGAPDGELDRARALCEAAAAASAGKRGGGAEEGDGEDGGEGDGETAGPSAGRPAVRAPDPAYAGPRDTAAAGIPASSPAAAPASRSFRRIAALVVTSLVLVLVGAWWVTAPRGTGDGTGTVAAPSAEPVSRSARWPLVQKGDRFWQARTVQYLLVAHGHELETDGIFGERTEAAVKAFQTGHHLLSDGKVGKQTWQLLLMPVDSRSEGPEVMALQNLLTNAGLPTDSTGTFSAVTGENLGKFQRSHGLPVSGRADHDTWRALMNAQAPPVRTRP